MQLWSLGKGSRTPGPKGPGPGTPNLFEEVTYLGPKSQALEPQDSELRDQRGRTKVTGQPLCLMPQRNSTAWSSWAVPHLPGHPQGRRHAGPPPTAGQHSPLHGPRSDGHHALRAGSEPLVGQVQDRSSMLCGTGKKKKTKAKQKTEEGNFDFLVEFLTASKLYFLS